MPLTAWNRVKVEWDRSLDTQWIKNCTADQWINFGSECRAYVLSWLAFSVLGLKNRKRTWGNRNKVGEEEGPGGRRDKEEGRPGEEKREEKCLQVKDLIVI